MAEYIQQQILLIIDNRWRDMFPNIFYWMSQISANKNITGIVGFSKFRNWIAMENSQVVKL